MQAATCAAMSGCRQCLLSAHIRPLFAPVSLRLRHFATINASDAREGTIIKHGGRYLEVTEFKTVKQARSASSTSLKFIDIAARKTGTLKFPASGKVDKVEAEKIGVTFLYIDKERNVGVVADEHFDQIEFDLALVGDAADLLEPDQQMQVFLHNDEVIKITLPHPVLMKLRKGK
uniref:Translation elongation factor P/YeiP central domain-containing protein n=1 Tax=Chromera velia CCMP2878 TaxID=1169474 RepID=A0A0G4HFX4_9ALVE|eukprot:Cvel_6711.t1-p1 / transcript=Cvel_6711.t1 / gene=Cvel_6711 / organism=Chromera_velia_CCMP2878 / gene_product=Elongation factor P, putative / transcript_product=Elongation factor P, putative / location=Cvel_scaffold335:29397-33037(-) / protein_length=174 / sequence_SO=supercontig / SO=protein_coding / is_pseudo=false